jgi:predicted metal-dependent phosphoesterase TrpH
MLSMERPSKTSDWHIHSDLSDGMSSPKGVLERAAKLGLREIAITDHDCIDAYRGELGRELTELGARLKIRVLSGVEIDCDLEEHDVEVLGYGFDPEHQELVDRLAEVQSQRKRRFAFYRGGLLRQGVIAEGDDGLTEASRSPMKVHLYRAALAAGRSFPGGYHEFKALLTTLGEAPTLTRPTFEEAVTLIRKAGGIALLAHPLYYAESVGLKRLVDAGTSAGCSGLELVCPYEFGAKGIEAEKVRAGYRELLHLVSSMDSSSPFKVTSRGTDVHDLDEWDARLQELESVERSLARE